VVARGGNEGQRRSIRLPLPIADAHVVAEHRPVVVRRHLEADHLRRVHVDDDPVEHRHHLVAGQGELGNAQRRVGHRVHGRVDQIHLAHLALVLLVGGDLLRVGRPEDDGAVAAGPAGVVGGVAEVLLAVGGQLTLAARGHLAHPEVPVANERRQLAVGRGHRDVHGAATPAATPAAGAAASARGGAPGCRARVRTGHAGRVAGPPAAVVVEGHLCRVGGQLDRLEGQRVGRVGSASRLRERCSQPRVVEGLLPRLRGRRDEDELVAVHHLVAVPEAIVRQPVRDDIAADDQRREGRRQEPLGALVVHGGDTTRGVRATLRRTLLGGGGGGNQERRAGHQGQRARSGSSTG